MSAYVPAPSSYDDAPDRASRLTPAVLWLLALTVGVYFLQVTVQGDLPRWLGFDTDTWASRPWTALTYAFVHADFWHVALNMYVLWAFGPRLERAWSPARFATFYLWCALGGVALHALFTPAAALVGASAATFGLLVAHARRWPNDEVALFGVVPMRMRTLVAFLVGINLLMGVLAGIGGSGSQIAYLAHLGGVVFALVWLLWPTGPSVERVRQRVSSTPDLGDELPRAVPRGGPARPRDAGAPRSEADDAVARSQALTAPPPNPPAPPPRVVRSPTPRPRPVVAAVAPAPGATDVDAVLDKISREGMGSLTADERRVLEETARKLRDG
jgi:membrane associated rhomboid family serine protease